MSYKAAVYEAMPAAYSEASDGGRLPAPARMVAYALRRLTGLGDELDMKYLLTGRQQGLINAYLEDHHSTAGWDIVRDARGTFREPHTGRNVPLGTLKVRDYLYYDGVDDSETAPQFSLRVRTHGPQDRFGAILYIEKEGFAELLAADRVQERWDIAVMSSKGYSVRAARQVLVTLATRHDVPVLVAHDFDQAGIGIYDLIDDEVDAIDLGLRLDDVDDPRWNLATQAETVTYRSDPFDNLVERGASAAEIGFLRPDKHRGKRVELNALVGRTFIDWLESKLEEHGVEKVVPPDVRLRIAYRRASRLRMINRKINEAFDASVETDAPDDLVAKVTQRLDEDRELTWDAAIAELAIEDES